MPDIPRQRTAPRPPRCHKPVRVGADLRRHRPPGTVQTGCGFRSPPGRAQWPETHAAGRHRAHTPCSPCRSVRPHRGWPDQAHVRKPAAGRAAHRTPAPPKTPCPASPTAPAARHRARHPQVGPAVGHASRLRHDAARLGKSLVHIPQRASAANLAHALPAGHCRGSLGVRSGRYAAALCTGFSGGAGCGRPPLPHPSPARGEGLARSDTDCVHANPITITSFCRGVCPVRQCSLLSYSPLPLRERGATPP